jgi:hypothetical protein
MSHDDKPQLADVELRLEEAEALIWALLDDRLDDAATQRLTQMMESDALVRARYIDCVQLHVDLTEHFAGKDAKPSAVVLPSLLPGVPGVLGMPQVAE